MLPNTELFVVEPLIESIAPWLSDTGKAYLLIPHHWLDDFDRT